MIIRIMTVLFSMLLLIGNSQANEKDKYFATQCFKSINELWLVTGENAGTKVDRGFSYWPLKEIIAEPIVPEAFYEMDLEIGVVYGWGEVKKRVAPKKQRLL